MVRLAAVRPAVNAVTSARAMSVRGMASEFPFACRAPTARTLAEQRRSFLDAENNALTVQSSPNTTGR